MDFLLDFDERIGKWDGGQGPAAVPPGTPKMSLLRSPGFKP